MGVIGLVLVWCIAFGAINVLLYNEMLRYGSKIEKEDNYLQLSKLRQRYKWWKYGHYINTAPLLLAGFAVIDSVHQYAEAHNMSYPRLYRYLALFGLVLLWLVMRSVMR